MLAWLQHMGKKRRRPVGSVDNGRGGGGIDLLPKAISAAVVLLVSDSISILMRCKHALNAQFAQDLTHSLLLHPQLLIVAGMAWRHHSAAAQPAVKDSAARDGPLAATAGSSIRGKAGQPRVYTYSIERELEHSPEAFTQGLEFDRSCQRNAVGTEECTDVLWESTGAANARCSLICIAAVHANLRRLAATALTLICMSRHERGVVSQRGRSGDWRRAAQEDAAARRLCRGRHQTRRQVRADSIAGCITKAFCNWILKSTPAISCCYADQLTTMPCRLFQLTWQSPKMFSYKVEDFDQVRP